VRARIWHHRVPARDADEDGLVVAAGEQFDLAALDEVREIADDVGTVAFEPIEERAGEVEGRLHFGVPIERGHERRIRALGHVREHLWEVPRWLVLVENQRQTQPIGHLEGILPNFACDVRSAYKSAHCLYRFSTTRALPITLRG